MRETGESYPDITLLPSIADLFNVSVDELLGTDSMKKEKSISDYLNKYSSLAGKDKAKTYELMKKAVGDFPGEHRLLIRYMNSLIMLKGGIKNNPKEIFEEITTVYDIIDKHCTDDSIRMWAKRLMCTYYKTLSYPDGKGIFIDKMEEILLTMPSMLDSRDYSSTFLYPPGEKHDIACRNAIDELLYLLNGAIINYCYYSENHSAEYKIKAIETILTTQEVFYSDGNYGKSWSHVLRNYGYLGCLYYSVGEKEKALSYLKKCKELTKKYDELPDISNRSALFFEDTTFKKDCKKMSDRLQSFLLRDCLDEELIKSFQFRSIIGELT